MSTEMNPVAGSRLILPIGANDVNAVDLVAIKSQVHYLWNPFRDINLVGAEGLTIRLGKGRAYLTEIQRCQVYPIWNINYLDSKWNAGEVSDSEMDRGNARGETAPQVEVVVYAGVCAADMIAKHGEATGMRVLTPLTGMDGKDMDTAAELIYLVQPDALKLKSLRNPDDRETLLFDLTHIAPERIKGAGLEPPLQAKAFQLRDVMLTGVRQAIKSAENEWGLLAKEFNRTRLGHAGKTTPSDFDKQLAFLLGEPVPSVVVRPQNEGDPDMRNAIKLLTQRAMQEDAVVAGEARSLLDEIRAERAALAQERLDMEAAKEVPPKKK